MKLIEKQGKYYEECEVIMLEVDQDPKLRPEKGIYGNSRRKLIMSKPMSYSKQRHLYILSNKDIKKDDWVIDGGKLAKATENFPATKWCQKILATTQIGLGEIPNSIPGFNFPDKIGLPQPSQDFIEFYIKAYNDGKPITKVLVEYNYKCKQLNALCTGFKDACSVCNYNLKISKDNTITIKEIEERLYTLDEMKKACACGIDIACKKGENDFHLFEDLINNLNNLK